MFHYYEKYIIYTQSLWKVSRSSPFTKLHCIYTYQCTLTSSPDCGFGFFFADITKLSRHVQKLSVISGCTCEFSCYDYAILCSYKILITNIFAVYQTTWEHCLKGLHFQYFILKNQNGNKNQINIHHS